MLVAERGILRLTACCVRGRKACPIIISLKRSCPVEVTEDVWATGGRRKGGESLGHMYGFRVKHGMFNIHLGMSGSSATGTRTRVARVRAEYPNQLDYSGLVFA